MDDFNSETDSDYTSYWRDWAQRRRRREDGMLEWDLSWASSELVSAMPQCPPVALQALSLSTMSTTAELAPKSARIATDGALSFFTLSSPRKRKSDELSVSEPEATAAKLQDCPDGSAGHGSLTSSTLDSMLLESPGRAIPNERVGSYGAFDKSWHLFWKENAWNLEKPFISRFISSRGNEYFCEIDEEYLTDRFNLTGLNTEVQYYQYALDLVTDVFDLDCDDEMRETIEKSARHLYGLVHARYIVTTRGLSKMLEKYKKSDFGKCPRVMCKSHALLPMGQADNPNVKAVKLYCAKCEDIYNPKSSRHASIDGAYFGTSFHNIIFQVYPALIPPKSYDRYVPRIYGFKVHAPATLIRWQHAERDDMRKRLRKLEIESGFKDDEEDIEAEDSEEEDEEEADMDAVGNGVAGGGGELRNQI